MSPVDELPVGTVTFLFTDIEGSTRLLKQLRERYGEALEEHQRILRETFAAHEGHEIDTQGDSFFVAFRRAKEAVAAAVEAQQRLAEHDWPEGVELRVRMGIHTGEPSAAGQRYVGLGVHRAARISAAGHGGQVLVSQATRELLRDDPLPDVSLRDLGEHQLKDLDEPERLYQLVAPGLDETFPPLTTAGATPFEGREGELAEAAVEEMTRWRRPGRRTLLLATFGAAVIGVVAGVLLTQGGGSTAIAAPDSVGVVDASSGKIGASVPVGSSPGGVAAGSGAIWVANTDEGTVSRIDTSSNHVRQTIQVGGGPAGVAVGGGGVWVTNGTDGTVSRIDPSVNREVKKIHVGNGPVGIAYGAKKVWVANSVDGTVSEIDPTSLKVTHTIPAVPGVTGVVVAFGRVWLVSPTEGVLVSLDPSSRELVDRVGVGVDPIAVAAGDGAIWVANRDDDTISEIAPQPSAHVSAGPFRVGHGPLSLAVVGGGVWVANGPDGTLMRVDASNGEVDKVVNLANPPQALAGTADGIYVAVRSSGLEHHGGTLRVEQLPPDFIDPALAYTEFAWTILSMTNDGLVGLRRVGGIEGVQLVPDLADALPTPTDDGRTYTFHLRPGIRYSTGRLVQPADFRLAIERDLEAAKPESGGSPYFGGIVGASACRPGHPCDLSRGIVADETARTVTFHLTEPDADFLSKLTLPFADAVPAGTPVPSGAGDRPLSATGPYEIVDYRRNKSLRLVRNPHFREWSADAQPAGYPDRLVFTFPGSIPGSSERAVHHVLHGRTDVVPDADIPPLSKEQLTALAARYPGQLRLSASAITNYFFLNTRVAPFDDVRVRRAVNYALDRRAYVASLGPGYVPTCQILPPNYPAYRRTCLFGSGGNAGLDRARRLVQRAGRTGTSITVWMPAPAAAQGGFIVSMLNSIGLRAHLKTIVPTPTHTYFARIVNPRTRAQMGFAAWGADFPSASGFLPALFSCAVVSSEPSEFCDPAVDRLFAKAEKAQGQNPPAATVLWQKAERAILQQSPLVPTYVPQNIAFVAKRVANFQYHPQWQVLLDQLWLK